MPPNRQFRRAVDSLVLGTVFAVLLPMWLLGNIFVAVFPPRVPASAMAKAASSPTGDYAAVSPPDYSTEPDTAPTPGRSEAEVSAGEQAESPAVVTEDEVEPSPPARPTAVPAALRVESAESRDTPDFPALETQTPALDGSTPQPPNRTKLVPTMRAWTDRASGRKVDAVLVEVKGNQVCLRKADGQQFTVPLDRFSRLDEIYVEALRDQMSAEQ